MSDSQQIQSPAVRTRSGPSIVWLVPVVTAIVGAWLIFHTLSQEAPLVTISFKTAEGIEAGKTKIKYKSVDVGVVEEIRFAEDFSHVILSARFNQGMEDFLRRDTRFWVVKPQLSIRGVSGLDTLVSGSYIEIDPGPGAPQRHYVGLEQQPLITTDDAGTRITLITQDLGSLGAGSPIYYQGLLAGEVLGYELGSDARSIYIHAFIRDPFDRLVRGNSRFWNTSGVDVSMGADGLEVKTASLTSLLFGGISFETPDSLERGTIEVEDLVFTLYDSYDVIEEQAFTQRLRFVMYFDGSVRGLNKGAPVEFKGIRIGTVLDVRLEFDPTDTSFRIPVLIEIEPERIIDRETQTVAFPQQTLQTLVERGLRARLQTGSFLTGQLFVELNMYPGTPINLVGDDNLPYPELPTIAGAFEVLTQSVEAFLAKLETLDIDAMGNQIIGILEGTNNLLNQDKNEETVTDLQESMRSLRNILRNVEEGDLEQTINAANNVLLNLESTLKLVEQAMNPNAPLQYNVIKVTGELEETARAIRALVETLERQPQSLIFGRPAANDEEKP